MPTEVRRRLRDAWPVLRVLFAIYTLVALGLGLGSAVTGWVL